MITSVTTTPADPRSLAEKKSITAKDVPEAADRNGIGGKVDATGSGDRVTIGSKSSDGVYRKSAAADTLDARLTVMRDLVARMFEKQGLSLSIDAGDGKTTDLKEISPQQATDLVSDDGYWGVEKTAQRIADFAIHAAGDDRTKLDAIKESVMKGFSMAEKAFGGALPPISRKTLDAVMSKLDQWSGGPEAPTA